MKAVSPLEEAENCRRQALSYIGRPEAAFLLRVAREFERLGRNEAKEGRLALSFCGREKVRS